MEKTLVLLAAGLGSRYGSFKQIDGVGPNGELLMQYAVFDAMRAGFTRIVFIIKPDMLLTLRRLCGGALSRKVRVSYALQTPQNLPGRYQTPPLRQKPLGTVHALWCARPLIETPFAVLNADDYYGVTAFEQMSALLDHLKPQHQAAMIGYRLAHTLSDYGTVTRGICAHCGETLTGITETYHIGRGADGTVRDLQTPHAPALEDGTLVSMNFWGFTPWIFDPLETCLTRFLNGLSRDDIQSEYQLPTMVGDLMAQDALHVAIRQTQETWFGMTYMQDKPQVRQCLAALHQAGVYPPSLLV